MKNIPHQFNDLNKFFRALQTIKQLIEEEIPLKDGNLGEQLLRNNVINPGRQGQSIDEYLLEQSEKIASNRGYHTAAREMIKFFKLIGFLIIYDNKSGELTHRAIELLSADNDGVRKSIWQNAFLNLGVEGMDGEISYPYRTLLKLVQDRPGIENSKLMLALEVENNSEEEYNRVLELADISFNNLLVEIGITATQARNAVKILPAIAIQLNDIEKRGNFSFPVGELVITEDEISTEVPQNSANRDGIQYSQFREVTSNTIAIDPIFSSVSAVSIDLTESIRIRQKRLAEHQEIVRLLGRYCAEKGFNLYEGKFDCLAVIDNFALIFEIKTIVTSMSDQEKQTVKGVGQLKYYKFSIVQRQMNYSNIPEFLVYSQKPNNILIEFCTSLRITVLWLEEGVFKIFDVDTNSDTDFNPLEFII